MLVKKRPRPINLILNKARDPRRILRHAAVHGHQKLPEQIGEHLLIAPRTAHQLIPHPAEEILVLPRNAGVEDVPIRRDLIMPENIADLPPRKVDKPHLGLVFAKIEIILHLLGLKQNHAPRRHNDFLPI